MTNRPQNAVQIRSVEGTARVYEVLVRSVTGYAIYMLDPDGRVTTWNAGSERAKGYMEAEIVGRHFGCFYSPEDQHAGLPDANLNIARTVGTYDAEGSANEDEVIEAFVLAHQRLTELENRFRGGPSQFAPLASP